MPCRNRRRMRSRRNHMGSRREGTCRPRRHGGPVSRAARTQERAGAGSDPSLARSTAIMSLGTVLSRITGVIRLAVIAAALGVAETRVTDSYNLANTAPNIVYELVLG